MFWWFVVDPLVIIEGQVSSMDYLNIVADKVPPAMLHFYPSCDETGGQYNVTIHQERTVLVCVCVCVGRLPGFDFVF